jgi:SpoVK/Ycf46/Vps4 family AAA+-type ATPase
MATADHLRALLRAFMRRDDAAFVSGARVLISEEAQKGHRLLAEDLERILANGNHGAVQSLPLHEEVPRDKESGLPLVHVERPTFGWERVVLDGRLQELLDAVAVEFRRRDVLKTYGMSFRRKLLFFGPPGCGKTVTARVLAGVLDLPLLYVRFDSVVSSYLGETATNLRRVFDFAARGSWVVLLDEFDAIGKGRDNPFEHGELKRVVNSLLQIMDGFTGDSLIIAATNHEGLLDPALWRRFDEICYFGAPSTAQRLALAARLLSAFRHDAADLRRLSPQLGGMTGSDVERVCIDAVRRALVDGREVVSRADLEHGLKLQRNRLRLSGHRDGLERKGGGTSSAEESGSL